MIEASTADLSQYRFAKAEECWTAAKNLLEDELFADSANRSYYAVFHAARAVLALDGADFKKHSGVISYFQQHYIKTGIFPHKLSDTLRTAFRIRQSCDYSDFFLISREDVVVQLRDTREFIDTIQTYLQEKWSKSK